MSCAAAFARHEAVLVAACALVACGGTTTTEESGDTSGERAAALAGGCEDAATPEDSSASGGYFTCNAAAGCVAVRLLADCCYNGWKVAVAKDAADAYLAATACTARFCPEYIVNDTRVAACDMAAHHCVMVEPPQAAAAQ